MIQKGKAWIGEFFDSSRGVQLLLFNVMIPLAILGGTISLLISVCNGSGTAQIATVIAAVMLLCFCFYLANWKKRLMTATGIVLFMTSVVLFPIMFFSGGGAYGGMGYWFVLAILFNFLMVSGVLFHVLLIAQILVMVVCFWISYRYPGIVTPFDEPAAVLIDMIQSLIITVIVTGVIIKFQVRAYEKNMKTIQNTNAELVESERRAEQANRAKSDFLANMSHEIRTPLNAILGMNEMILKESQNETIKGYATAVENSSAALLSIINNILDISKIESGRIELVDSEYQLSSLYVDCYNMMHKRAVDKGLDFKFSCDSKLPKMVSGDVSRVRQIIINILSNAVKYTQQGSVRVEITGEKREGTLWLKTVIADTGIGMKQENLDKLFEKFERFDRKLNQNIEGTGLGMSITKELVQLMQGTLQVESEYGKGSTFSVVIPQGIVDDTPVGEIAFDEMVSRVQGERVEKILAPNAHVLIVDDVKMNLTVMESLLKDTRIQVDTAMSGRESLVRCVKQKYDVIFMDHMMPGMDGIETLAELKKLEDSLNENTPIVMLTANAIVGARDEYIKAGFMDYLTKPVREQELKRMLLKYLPKERIQTKTLTLVEQLFPTEEKKTEEKSTESRLEMLERVLPEFSKAQALEHCVQDEALLEELLRDFAASENCRAADDYYHAEDWANYAIQVHALKSSAQTIGFLTLSEEAKQLEYAAKGQDIAVIKKNHGLMVEQEGRIREGILRAFS